MLGARYLETMEAEGCLWGISLVCVTRLGGLKNNAYVRIMGGCWSLVSDKVIQTLFVSCVPSLSVACMSSVRMLANESVTRVCVSWNSVIPDV